MKCSNFNEAWEGLEQFIDNLDMDDLDIGHDEGMFLISLIQDEMNHSKANVEYQQQFDRSEVYDKAKAHNKITQDNNGE